ncbi:MAG: L,D-transpeptidase [Burkholderiales bacterium]|nr:L,D-transpeptidase [Burkholderiales bacterium]
MFGASLAACQLVPPVPKDVHHQLIISVAAQNMRVMEDGQLLASYPVSTAKRGIGDAPDSYMTPGGRMEIAEKFGAGMPIGTVFKDRMPTGEVVAPDAPGRDPVVTRILWLRGLEERNRNAYPRFIYIHGTPQESLLGTPASYGCIRMRSADIVKVFDLVGIGAEVIVTE